MTVIKEMLEGPKGFYTDVRFTPDELSMVRGLIKAQWLKRIEESGTGRSKAFEDLEMNRYHEQCQILDHKNMWPKSKRILCTDAVKAIRQTSLIKALEAEFGSFAISGEDGIEKEEVYWRLVRPDGLTDVGPLHADEWFWALGHGNTPAAHQRVKVWISIYSEIGRNGFKFVAGSHKKKWRYHGVAKDGYIKPQIDEDVSSLGTEIFMSQPGQAIVFHDRLLHGGEPGGSMTRVSLEFTMFVKNENYFN
jgi:hypothetical protein